MEQGGFSHATRPDDRRRLACGELEAHGLEDRLALLVTERNVVELDRALGDQRACRERLGMPRGRGPFAVWRWTGGGSQLAGIHHWARVGAVLHFLRRVEDFEHALDAGLGAGDGR